MAKISASTTVVGVFGELKDAEDAVRDLQLNGFSKDDISLVANRNVGESNLPPDKNYPDVQATGGTRAHDKTGDIAADAGLGAAIGGLGGLLVGFAGLAIPGIGPILAAGPLVAALTGVGIGAAAGGVIGALVEAGVPEEDAHAYAEGVRRGHVLVTVKTSDPEIANFAQQVMDKYRTVDVEDRTTDWKKRGWAGHNPGAEPLSADELRREREYYGAANKQGAEWDKVTERERVGADPEFRETAWPHREAHDQSESLEKPAVRSTEINELDIAGQDRSYQNSNPDFGASVENNRRVTDPAVARAESGFERAMESASRVARRRARIYSNFR